jgi:adenine-specific DNA-methyltransferase
LAGSGRIATRGEKEGGPVSNELRSLLARVEDSDPETAKELRRHIDTLQSRRKFGLNFERHLPESVALTGRSISIGDKVRFLPPRGEVEVESDSTWIVTDISAQDGERVAKLIDPRTKAEASRALDNLVFVADFRDPIYPGLEPSGEPVLRGNDKPFHTVINAENYHAIEAMLFTHEGKVDCIYIDPPYNTRANDWKYNNDYVEPGDSYAHSKWLAFMERRQKLAKKLLNPRNSVLIVTIDEKEYLRLGLLLEQVFPGHACQMVTTVISPAGQARGSQMYRVEEYIFFVYIGAAAATGGTDNMLGAVEEEDLSEDGSEPTEIRVTWENLVRRGTSARRVDRERQFFPIFIDPETKRIVSVGESLLPVTVERSTVEAPEGTIAVWPIRSDGTEGRWRVGRDGVVRLLERGLVRVGRYNRERDQWSMNYLLRADVQRLDRGEIVVDGWTEQGTPILKRPVTDEVQKVRPKTVWNRESHNAGNYGTALLRKFIPGRSFPFPKSLYAVEDTLRFFVADKPDALIVDFFAGSGTTAHAVMRLNKQDNGRRRSISVTNNEINDLENDFRSKGLRPGDTTWESEGICERVTKPRIKAAVTGLTPEGEPINGDYAFNGEFPISDGLEENVAFFTLTYENPALVELDMAFERIAPLLWLRAGSEGRIIDRRSDTFEVADTYAVLFSVDASKSFLTTVEEAVGLRVAYIVTDDETQYQAVAGQLPDGVESVRLYESYQRTFQINTGRA